MNLAPGDIVVSEGTSISSRLIQIFTRSWWSHVGIVTGSDKILEATKSGDNMDVREVSLSEFKKNAKAVAVFHRKPQLDASAVKKLSDRSEQLRTSKYAVEQAIFSNYLPTMKVLLLIYFSYPIFLICDYLVKSDVADAGVIAALKLLGIILLFWIAVYLMLTLTFKSQWGVHTMERLYNKTRLGRFLLKRQQYTFCSKLVAMIDSEVGGVLMNQWRPADNFRPVDIVLACHNMNWERSYLKESERFSLSRGLLSFWFRR